MGTGTDIAIEAGNIALVKGSPLKVIEALKLSQLTFKTIKQNLFWAFIYNIAAIPLAALGLLNPMIAAGRHGDFERQRRGEQPADQETQAHLRREGDDARNDGWCNGVDDGRHGPCFDSRPSCPRSRCGSAAQIPVLNEMRQSCLWRSRCVRLSFRWSPCWARFGASPHLPNLKATNGASVHLGLVLHVTRSNLTAT
jgi:hypothetical protein